MRASLRRLLIAYCLLLALSHLVRLRPSEPASPSAGLDLLSLPIVGGKGSPPAEISVAFRRWRPADASDATPKILLLHGSPGSSRDFDDLAPILGERFEILAPDLPGFGASDRRLPDYSIRTHALYATALLDRLGISQVHVVGFSMGGGVALELTRLAGERVTSLTLLSATGVQELELLGDYHLNRAIHALQLGSLWLLREGLPHFGWLDGAFFGVEYARNFFDTDQRPLRAILQELELPTLIIHGEHDVLVPVAAAREHHRLVPQSELVLFDASHFMVFRHGQKLAEPIFDLIARAEAGRAVRRSGATPERLAASRLPFDFRTVEPAAGLTLLVLALLIALATLLTEDLACIATGLLVAQGRIGFLAGTLACFSGIVLGDVLLYWAGSSLGRVWLRRAPLRWLLTPEKVQRSSEWFRRRGPAVIFLSRFLPGTRVATYVTSGVLETGLYRFLLYLVVSVAIWTPLLVGAASFLGGRIFTYFESFERWALPTVLTLLVTIWIASRLAPLLVTWKGRRRLLGWWSRWTRWEFWPLWLFYPPVLVWIARLALKYRSPTIFTAANPAIPAGGLVGESKAGILNGLSPEWVARYRLIPATTSPQARVAAVSSFAEQNELDLPLVLKPDVGERGNGVRIVRSWREVEDYCATARADFLVQEFVPGPEYGVFYVHLPDRESGRIFSITEKLLPSVAGDGESTLEELILRDPRAFCLAPLYLSRFGSRRSEILGPGTELRLTELGTHCRGAIFRDGHHLLTAELEIAVETISQSFQGFFFGRYDIRCPSPEDFSRGRNLRVIELNGVASEATHIYDAANSLADAYRVLFEQWRLAFEVGHLNRLQIGARPEPLRVVLRRLIAFWRGRAHRFEPRSSQPSPAPQ